MFVKHAQLVTTVQEERPRSIQPQLQQIKELYAQPALIVLLEVAHLRPVLKEPTEPVQEPLQLMIASAVLLTRLALTKDRLGVLAVALMLRAKKAVLHAPA